MKPEHPDLDLPVCGACSHENVTKYAQDIVLLLPLECEWNGTCEAELNSWSAMKEHVQLHLRQLQEEVDGGYRCRLPRCACFYHATLHDLHEHVRSGHLSRLPLPCPARDCTLSFTHHTSLPVHFSHIHGDLLNTPAIHKGEALKKLWTPNPPSPSLLAEVRLDLPLDPVPMHTLVTLPIARSRRKEWSQAPTASQKRRKWNKMRGEGYTSEDDHKDSAPFDPLPATHTIDLADFADFIIRRKSLEPIPQLSRPPRVVIPPIPEKVPPVSMGFGAFEEKFRALEKAGLIDGTGEWPDENDDTPAPSRPSSSMNA